MDYVEVKLTLANHDCIEAIANAFVEQSSGGVVIDDPQLIASYANRGQWDDHEFSEELLAKKTVDIKGYFAQDQFLTGRIEGLKDAVAEICRRMDMEMPKVYFNNVQEEDWVNNWKQYFKPERIGKRTVVKPTWEEYSPKEGELIIEIDPGMAFGTGNHATTALCINILEDYVKEGMQVLDVGTGSGILAIQAALLGADKVEAMDFDMVAVKAAGENTALNNLQDKVKVFHSDLLKSATMQGDIIIANIVADIIIRLLPNVPQYLKGEKIFISSGIIDNRKDDVLTEYQRLGFKILRIEESKGWVAIVGQYLGEGQ